jgi:hypothetical protein
MAASIFIIAFSLALLIYWFRYTCLLLLSSSADRRHAAAVAEANRLHFLEIQGARIREAEPSELPALRDMLERDYRIITFLLKHSGGLETGGVSLEDRLLMLDFKLMQMVYAMGRLVGVNRVRAALQEMAQVVARLAGVMGERLDSAHRA